MCLSFIYNHNTSYVLENLFLTYCFDLPYISDILFIVGSTDAYSGPFLTFNIKLFAKIVKG